MLTVQVFDVLARPSNKYQAAGPTIPLIDDDLEFFLEEELYAWKDHRPDDDVRIDADSATVYTFIVNDVPLRKFIVKEI